MNAAKPTHRPLHWLYALGLVALTACPTPPESKLFTTLTISESGALVNASGVKLRAMEPQKFAGHRIELYRSASGVLTERLVNDGVTIRERAAEAELTQTTTTEHHSGDSCTAFTDRRGTQVANSCAIPSARADDVRCERLDTYSDTNLDTSSDSGPLICTMCYDTAGHVVTRACHPHPVPECQGDPSCMAVDCPTGGECSADLQQCHVVRKDQQTCRICQGVGGERSEQCFADLPPARCEVAEMEPGLRCTYCYDFDGAVVQRSCQQSCTSGENCSQPNHCESFRTETGDHCDICYDRAGNTLELSCQQPPGAAGCREYREDNGRVCVICISSSGDITRRECSEPACYADENLPCQSDMECPPQSFCGEGGLCRCSQTETSCRLIQTEVGDFCEICGDHNGDQIEDIQDAYCYREPDSQTCVTEVNPEGQPCRVCRDSAGQITENCETAIDAPSRCVVQQIEGSLETCEICYDDLHAVVSNSCEQVQCHPEDIPLGSGVTGLCETCGTADEEISRSCVVEHCDATDPDLECSPPLPECDPNTQGIAVPCTDRFVLYFDPQRCDSNPWQQDNHQWAGEMQQVYGWLQQLGVTSFAIRFENIYDTSCAACSCPRGDRLYIQTDEPGLDILLGHGFIHY